EFSQLQQLRVFASFRPLHRVCLSASPVRGLLVLPPESRKQFFDLLQSFCEFLNFTVFLDL
ncbi:hypothetical protein MWU61_11030, partial [Loktanella sp. F6476L]|uniref:hypothetical protein n=1 Tax=Loktanella sp. F6476L TaxID=2926405 RepID=UPI001FF17069